MKKLLALFTLLAVSAMLLAFTANKPTAKKDNKYIGSKSCGMCHKAKTGNQDKIWKESDHATAYANLTSDKGKAIATANGIEDATKSNVCLKCHATAAGEANLWDKKFKIEDGVQCEACHGAGSNYKSLKIMKDYAQSVANGMVDFTKVTPSDVCKKCHEGTKPKDHPAVAFKFDESWAKIKHPIPAK